MKRGGPVWPSGAPSFMTPRTLANSHPVLLRLLDRGMSVLDVGCGPGALTREMARLVSPGRVMGIDVNPGMVAAAAAASRPGAAPNLAFRVADIRDGGWTAQFALVNATRMLQWVPDPEVAVLGMARAATPGGLVVLRDYDHTRAEWRGEPSAWTRFYTAFLRWRADGGLDNAIAKRLPALADVAGLAALELTSEIAVVRAGEPDFFRVAGAWRMVVEGRGREMVAAGALAEAERRAALEAYTEWMQRPDAHYTSHEACLVTRRR